MNNTEINPAVGCALKLRVRLIVPDHDKEPIRSRIHGEHLAYHNQTGVVLCGVGNGGAWVHFDGQPKNIYVGCPIAWLERE